MAKKQGIKSDEAMKVVDAIINYYLQIDNPPPTEIQVNQDKIQHGTSPGVYFAEVVTKVEYIPKKPKSHRVILRLQFDNHSRLIPGSVRYV